MTFQPIIVQKNIQFSETDPKLDQITPNSSVCCHHIDHDRDEILGYPLSNYNLNYRFDKKDERDIPFTSTFKVANLPVSSSLRSEWGTVLDQLQLGSCVSNAVAYQLRFLNKKKNNVIDDFSRLFIYYNGRVISNEPITEDTGLSLRAGFDSVATNGCPVETLWPYIVSEFTDKPPASVYSNAIADKNIIYYSVSQNLTNIKQSIVDGFPVAFGMTLCESFMSQQTAKTGIVTIPTDSEQRVGGHAMNIIGYDDVSQMFECSNQWGIAWGNQGYCHIPYQLILDPNTTSDMWTGRSFSIPTEIVKPIVAPVVNTIKNWIVNTHYNTGDKVHYLGHTFICLITHRSITAWVPPAVPIIWKVVPQ